MRSSANQVTEGVLVRSDNQPLIMLDGTAPTSVSSRCTHVYELSDGCVWKLSEITTRAPVSGGLHHVTHCQLDDGTWVLIDWSLDQFTPLPPGVHVRLHM